MSGASRPLTAVVTNSRSPQTTGLEWPSPGIAVFHRTCSPLATSQRTGAAAPSATPAAPGPRNEGQWTCAEAGGAAAPAGIPIAAAARSIAKVILSIPRVRIPLVRRRFQIWPAARSLLGRLLLPAARLAVPTERLGVGPGARVVCPRGLGAGKVVYSFGVGRDLSFELALVERFGVAVHAFDPTPRAIAWMRRQTLPARLRLHELGVAGFDGTARFRAPADPDFVSYSLVSAGTPAPGDVEGPVLRLGSVARRLGHRRIELLKLDVEGAELAVLADLAESDLDVGQILVEFHHRLARNGVARTRAAIRRLEGAGYRIFHAAPRRDEYGFLRV